MIKKEMKSLADLTNEPIKTINITDTVQMHILVESGAVVLLRFSQTCELSSSKAAFAIAFFAAVNHNYDHKERTLKHKNTLNGSKSTNHKSQTLTF